MAGYIEDVEGLGENMITDRGPLIDWTAYGQMHAERGEIWQARLVAGGTLLDPQGLTRVARERGVGLGGGPEGGIDRLWLLGWLKADLVRVDEDIDEAALLESAGDRLVRVGADEYGRLLYADARAAGFGGGESSVGGAAKLRLPDGIVPLFHPFRYHVLHWVEGMLSFNVTPLSTLTTRRVESLNGLHERIAGWKDERFGSPSFRADLMEFNDRVALAAIAEPAYWNRVFGVFRRQTDYEPEELGLSDEEYDALEAGERRSRSLDLFDQRMDRQREAAREVFKKVRLDRIEEERRRLCEATDVIEPNRNLQTVLRITRGVDRIYLEGALGGAMLTRTMAEILRRASEDIFGTELPEEDELGLSLFPPEARKEYKRDSFGSHRLLDNAEAGRDFVRMREEPVETRVRWYVEGDTEEGALAEALGSEGKRVIEVVNLRAQLGRRGRDASSFRRRLERDLDEGIFSFVSVDTDDKDVKRIVEQAAKEKLLFGRFFFAKPDFEIENFEPEELGEVLWRWLRENEAQVELTEDVGRAGEDKQSLLSAVRDAPSGKKFFEWAYDVLPERTAGYDKGQEWGRRLTMYVTQKPDKESGARCQFVEAVEEAYKLLGANYTSLRQTHEVDLSTGGLVLK